MKSSKQKKSGEIFDKQKLEALTSVDLSRKGNIDSHILSVVALINEQADYFTTSSCSGRILIFIQAEENGKIKKRHCEWLNTTHDLIANVQDFASEFFDKLNKFRESNPIEDSGEQLGIAYLKFEPMVLHVQCRDLTSAQNLHTCAIESGFKNSGLSVSKKGKIISATRSSHSLEVPLTDIRCNLVVSSDYLSYIIGLANAKLAANFDSIERLRLTLIKSLGHPEPKS